VFVWNWNTSGWSIGQLNVHYDSPQQIIHPVFKIGSKCQRLGPGWRIHGSVEDTKLSTNKQHTLSQLLVKEGDSVGLIFCCPALQQNLHLLTKTGFAVIMSECILELLGHCAAAASLSRTLVFNGRVPFARHSLLRSFVGNVFACQTANNHGIVEIDVNPASSATGNTCHPGARPSWVSANGGRAR
jgi:hypothetical protein